jgi:diguanylate cyclase (GGDEF)-like protein/PAS domain S-box-containing protein
MIILSLLCVVLYLTSLYSYALFHIVAESFSIVIAFSLFMIAWNTRQLATNNYVLFLSIAFVFAGLIDFVHTLAYKGMGLFQGFDANLPTQLWIMARYLQSLSLLAAPWFIDRKLNIRAIFGFYLSATILLLAAAFSGMLFPDCFIEGKGLTPFKIVSEYAICLILISSLVLLLRRRETFDPIILHLIAWSIISTIVAELAFTFYISVYGLSNLVGHYFKILSFYLVYRAIIVIDLENPYRLLFYDLQKNREEMQTILDASPVMIFYKDRENRFIRVNKALAEATGLTKDAMEGKTVFEIYPHQTKDYWEDDKEVIASGKPKINIIEPLDTATGTRWVQTDKIPYTDKEGRIVGIIGFAVDITERKQAEEALRKSKAHLDLALQSAYMGVWDWDIIANKRYFDDRTCHLLGINPATFTGSADEFIGAVHPDDREFLKATIARTLEQGVLYEPEYRAVWPDGSIHYITARGRLVHDDLDRPIRINGLIWDITERKRMEEKILALSITDQLTGLHNRRGFLSLAGQQLRLAERNKSGLLLFFADLDGLKWINDALGHEEGDKALIEAASVFKETFRTSDIIARLGGDEYAALAVDITQASSEMFTARLQSLIDTRNHQENREYRLSISVGCSYYDPENPYSLDELMASADKLMYEQKQNKRASLSCSNQ